jgi:hypothetical protein
MPISLRSVNLSRAEISATVKRQKTTQGKIIMATPSGFDPNDGLQEGFQKVHDRLDSIDTTLKTLAKQSSIDDLRSDVKAILNRLPPKP